MPSELCKCGNERRPEQRTCKACHAMYMRTYRRRKKLKAAEALKEVERMLTRTKELIEEVSCGTFNKSL